MSVSIHNSDNGVLNFDEENGDPFALPPPLVEDSLPNDSFPRNNIEDTYGITTDINPLDNVDVDPVENKTESTKKKRVFVPRVNLNEQRLCSEKGIKALKNLCSNVKFKGKGHEVSDLNKLLYCFEHWAQCLMPRWPFQNVVEKCEKLGTKSRVKNELKRLREDDDQEGILRGEPEEEDETEIALTAVDEVTETSPEPVVNTESQIDSREDLAAVELTEEQKERIRRNRELAFEIREAKRRRLAETEAESQIGDDFIEEQSDRKTQSTSEEVIRVDVHRQMNEDSSSDNDALENCDIIARDNISMEAIGFCHEEFDSIRPADNDEKENSKRTPTCRDGIMNGDVKDPVHHNNEFDNESDDEILNISAFDKVPNSSEVQANEENEKTEKENPEKITENSKAMDIGIVPATNFF